MSLLCDPGSKAGLGGSKENLGENVRHGMEQPEGLKSCYARTDKSRYGKAEHIVMYGRGSISCPQSCLFVVQRPSLVVFLLSTSRIVSLNV